MVDKEIKEILVEYVTRKIVAENFLRNYVKINDVEKRMIYQHIFLEQKSLELINFDYDINEIISDEELYKFVRIGYIMKKYPTKIFKYMDEYRWDESTYKYAAENGNLEALKWAKENGCPWDKWTCADAAENGHLKIIKWARENGCPWDKWTCARSAKNGHLEVLKWARENGCPWDEMTCAFAASNGHLEVLKWARENGCPE